MNIRLLRDEEISLALDLWKEAGAIPSVTDNAETIASLLKREFAAFLVAEADGRLIGSLIATFDGWRAHVYRLAVHPDYRRRGIAILLVNHSEEIMASWGAHRAIALVETHHPWAMGFWASAGYTNDSMTRFYKDLQGAAGSR